VSTRIEVRRHHPYPSLLALVMAEPETGHLELHPFPLPSRPNERAHLSLCISLSPQASPLPLPCTTAAKPPPTRSVHVTLDTLPIPTLLSLSVTLVHAREHHATPTPHWRRHSLPLDRYDTAPADKHLCTDMIERPSRPSPRHWTLASFQEATRRARLDTAR
jgi:hypothetical protein